MTKEEAVAALESLPEVRSIAVDNLSPTDVIVLECDAMLAAESSERIRRYLQEIWPNHRCVVLDKGFHLKVVREAPTP